MATQENIENQQNKQPIEIIYTGFLRRLIDIQLDLEEQLREQENRGYWYEDTIQEPFWELRKKIMETMDCAIEDELRKKRGQDEPKVDPKNEFAKVEERIKEQDEEFKKKKEEINDLLASIGMAKQE